MEQKIVPLTPYAAPAGLPGASTAVSGEFKEYDGSPKANQSRRDYIKAIYEQELGRDADEGGLDYWEKGAGAANGTLEGFDLIREMRNSAGMDPDSLYQDPAYAAYIRGNRQQMATINADKLQRQRDIDNERTIYNAQSAYAQEVGLEDVNDEAESRGMYGAGSRTKNRQKLITDIGHERGAKATEYARRGEELNRAAASDHSDLSRDRDQQEVAARQRLTQKSIQKAADAL